MNQNILQGIKIQEKYLHDIEENGESNIVFADAIKDLGFSSLDDFFSQKVLYQLRTSLHEQYFSTTPAQIMNLSRECIQNKQCAVIDADVENNCVHIGFGKDTVINTEYCKQHNIEVYPYDGYGGAIVSGTGDYNLTLIFSDNIDIDTSVILKQIQRILSKYFDDVIVDSNDILIDGKKVMGATYAHANNMVFLGVAFAFVCQPDIVTAICGTPKTGKEIGCINPEILSRDQFKKELLSWLLEL